MQSVAPLLFLQRGLDLQPVDSGSSTFGHRRCLRAVAADDQPARRGVDEVLDNQWLGRADGHIFGLV